MTDFLRFQKSNCKNCYKCIRHCPVKSIRFTGNQANVITEECILCGQCYVVCPQNAKKIADETEIAGVLLGGDAPVVASVAPSFAAYFEGVGIKSLERALRKLGFASAEETALGATLVKREYERLTSLGEQDIIISSCCHTVNLLVEKYYPQLSHLLAPVLTPMQAHCADIKRRIPGAKTVFIGPCLSKKDEAADSGIDAALTFEELAEMLARADITIDAQCDEMPESRARLFPTSGGILKTLTERSSAYTYVAVDGTENCKNALDDIASGGLHKCFIEMSACVGSCIGGPVMEKYHNNPLRHYQAVVSYAGEKDFDLPQPEKELLAAQHHGILLEKRMPGAAQVEEILHKMGKFKPEDELNCGSCGYDSCREKAVAIYQGKAEISMCLPYLMEQSERFSSNILDNTPNGILVINEFYEIQQINNAAIKMLKINSRADAIGGPLVRVIDPSDFMRVFNDGAKIINKRDYYAECGRFLELTIVHDKVLNSLLAILRDVTDEENARRSKEELSRQTIETADRVVDKQMRVVQEIASLLGETTAETKIALTKLKESIANENGI